jgi:hypothetical protein
MRGVVNDAVAVYVNTPTCAVAFVARWCVRGDPPGFYDLRRDEPERRVPIPAHGARILWGVLPVLRLPPHAIGVANGQIEPENARQ